MGHEVTFSVDRTEFTSDASDLTVADLLAKVDLTVEEADLVSQDGVEHRNPDESIAVHDGARFDSRPRGGPPATRVIHYTVNGEEQTSSDGILTAGAILERAGAAASIDVRQLASYYLENIATGRGYNDLSEEVTVRDGDQFIAVHRGMTPVA